MSKDVHIKKITFSKEQLELAELKAKSMGLSFQNYVRHLITADTLNMVNKSELSNSYLKNTSSQNYKYNIGRRALEELALKWRENS